MKNRQFFQLVTVGNVANLNIYGDITADPFNETGVSASKLSAQLAALQGVTEIHVFINSYGGEVAEGLAIYHALKRHPAKVVTYCDGMACSIASVIFMAGDERIMCNPSFLMIHDAWCMAVGNAEEMRKQADDLDVITSASVTAYMEHCNLSEEELRAKMKAETWLTHTEALEMGFATGVEETATAEKPSQHAKKRAFELLLQAIQFDTEEEEDEDEEKPGTDGENGGNPPPDREDEEEPEEPEENGENGNSVPEKTPDDEENKKNSEKVPDKDEKDDETDPENPAQRWSGFFNALFRG